VQSLLPDGATVMTTGSSTLDEIGFTGLLKAGQHAWMNLKDRILAEKDPVRQDAVRRSATQSKYFLGERACGDRERTACGGQRDR